MTDEEVSKYWIVVTESGASWIGIPIFSGSTDRLRDAFAFRVMEARDARGQIVGFARALWPIEMVAGHQSKPIDEIEVCAAAAQHVGAMPPSARAELARMLDAAETMRAAASAGLVLAGS